MQKETRQLIRAGVPNDLRSTIWKLLIHYQVAEIKKKFGKYYYRNLCSTQGSIDEAEIQQLDQVLRAFCLHNPIIGYCQGMNFIAGTAMLLVGPEDTFWFLVAITEKYFNKSYFDHALTGAQADQEVLKELVARRLPRLAAHLEQYDIDLATVTLNWFLALFYDAVPFQVLCFQIFEICGKVYF
ncbi:unnamed protein product [Gongylonema pulchrum]|uniref:Rab-GAP TBC domain-containing protein n=1 Tax=Gongylonema pulchrum TaxID=637853 RepID=A0A3P6PUX1_9BILA|nr:unnamed protein product [Gongylonema pulchrum]